MAVLFATVWSGVPAVANTGATSRLTGSQPNSATPATSVPDTTSPSIALAGSMIAFSSDATNLVLNDTNGASDVFVRDLPTGRVTRVSVAANGAQANGASWDPAMSVDGRYVAFASKATNLVPGDENGVADIFLRDLKARRTQLVSLAPDGSQANGDSVAPFVSLFGRWVTFESTATNLSDYDDNGAASDAFLRDTRTRRTSRIIPPDGDIATPHLPSQAVRTTHAQISYDGRFMTFTRIADGSTPEQPAASDTFFYDRKLRRTTAIPSPPYASRLPNGHTLVCRPMSDHAVVSADGRFAAFESWSGCAVPPSDAGRPSFIKNPVANTLIYRFDLAHPRSLALVSLNSWGQAPVGPGPFGTGGDSTRPSISANGAAIAFQSDAVNLVAGDANGKTDVFVRDLGARTTSRVSMNNNGAEPNDASTRPSLSYEGRRIAFASAASNLVAGDTNLATDSFVHDRMHFYPNRTPVLRPPVVGLRKVDAMQKIVLQLRATDADGDKIRYGVILWRVSNGTQIPAGGLPDGATIDPVSGRFEWTPQPAFNPDASHQNACGWCEVKVQIVFWAGDPRGNSDVKLAEFLIRSAQGTAQCKVLAQCAT